MAPTGTGAPGGDRSQGVIGLVLNTITPETEKTCQYFWAFVRNYRLGEQRNRKFVMPGLVPGIHGLCTASKTWMAGTSPAMTALQRPRECA